MANGGYSGGDVPEAPEAGNFGLPQFVGGGGRVLVRNTFLDVADDFDMDDLAPPPLTRSSTAPPAYGIPDMEPSRRQVSAASSDSEEREEPPPEQAPEQAPATLPLTRCVTKDVWESTSDWSWAEKNLGSPSAVDSPHIIQGGQQNCTSPTAMQYQDSNQPLYYQVAASGSAIPVMPVQMVPVLIPVQQMPDNSQPMLGSSQPMLSNSQPVQSPHAKTPSPTGNMSWPPPPPNLAPTIERVPSGSCPPPQISPLGGSSKSAVDRQQELKAAGMDDQNFTAVNLPPPTPGGSQMPPQPQTLQRAFSISSSTFRIFWHVDARKLKGNDKQAVSPPFELSFGNDFPNVTFKMMLYPKVVNDAKGGASFKKAKGRGYVQVKCEAELSDAAASAQVKFRIGVAGQEPRGPQSHNFAQSAVCGLPKEQEEWDFNEVVDKDSQTFQVLLEIVPQ